MVLSIYETLFETVEQNLNVCDLNLPFDKEDYLKIVRKNPYEMDYDEFSSLVEEGHFNAFFYRFLNRLPVPGTMELFKKRMKMSGLNGTDGFDKYTVMAVTYDPEFCESGKRVSYGNRKAWKAGCAWRMIKMRYFSSAAMGKVLGWIKAAVGR